MHNYRIWTCFYHIVVEFSHLIRWQSLTVYSTLPDFPCIDCVKSTLVLPIWYNVTQWGEGSSWMNVKYAKYDMILFWLYNNWFTDLAFYFFVVSGWFMRISLNTVGWQCVCMTHDFNDVKNERCHSKMFDRSCDSWTNITNWRFWMKIFLCDVWPGDRAPEHLLYMSDTIFHGKAETTKNQNINETASIDLVASFYYYHAAK